MTTSTYQGVPGGPSDPSTPGPYCLSICRCGSCPQYPAQAAAAQQLREQEYAARDRKQAERDARRDAPRRAA